MLETVVNLKEIEEKKEIIKMFFSIENFLDNDKIDNTSYLFEKNWVINNNYISIPCFPEIFDIFNTININKIDNKSYNIYPLVNNIKIIEYDNYKKIAPFDTFIMSNYCYRVTSSKLNDLFFESPNFFLIFDDNFEFNILFDSDLGYFVITAKVSLINKVLGNNFIDLFLKFKNSILNTNMGKIHYYLMFLHYEAILKKQGYFSKDNHKG